MPRATAFDTIAPIDLSAIFDRWLFIPGVDGVSDQSGAWDAAGQTRTVNLDDGTSVQEELTSIERPSSFGYRVGPFPGPLGLLASSAEGEWQFSEGTDGKTQIEWTYRFHPAKGRSVPVRLLIAPAWRGYAQRALARSIKVAELACEM